MKKIAWIRVFSAHPILERLENLLRNSFPQYELETITVTRWLKKRPDLLARNSLEVLKEYPRAIWQDPHTFHTRFLRTPWMFQQVRRLVRERLAARRANYAFSFQFQSLFDTSVPGLPHYIYTDHTYCESQTYAYHNAPYSARWARLEREIYQNAACVFPWSANISRSLIEDYGLPEKRVVCAYTGPNIRSPGGPPERGADNHNILFVGSDWERKGGPALAAAFRQVLERIPTAQLTIIGPRPEWGPDLELPNCHAPGRVPLEQLEAYFRQAAVFCLPTRKEPFGNVFIDALHYGLPIVGTRVGGVPDVVQPGENGYLVEPEDVSGLAQALIELLEDPEKRRRFGECSYARGQARYTWENVGRIMRGEILRS